ncbi:hypothetical protein [Draconibacterium orientale]|uniref:hypothetical protein n=1 Tax=Draconibacterium orientale TaxID=1168034 RepID=UPI002A0A51B8|nr:hypothetical protein [Draconibacterium orientale]
MIPLHKDLQKAKENITEFENITKRVLQYLPDVISSCQQKNDYLIYSSEIAGTTKFIRPINKTLFIDDVTTFDKSYKQLLAILNKIKTGAEIIDSDKDIIDKTLYTIQQSIGAGLDLLVNPNSARKHVGNRFEELIKTIFTEIGVANKKIILQIPYETEEGTKTYKCENDLIISPFGSVKSSSKLLDEKEVVVSIKTTSKDRMGKMFIDKILLERFVEHPQKVIGIFLNDVQRKEADNISFTLVSGLFMVYSKFLTELEGVYYLDPPPNANKKPYSNYMRRFSELLTTDLNRILTT